MKTTTYIRKPLQVEAIQVTEENLYEVAKWCGGDVHTDSKKRKKFIQVDVLHPLRQQQTRAEVGYWVLKSEQGFKIYANGAFEKGFELPEMKTGAPRTDPELSEALTLAFQTGPDVKPEDLM